MSLTRIFLCGTVVAGLACLASQSQAETPDPAATAAQVDQLLRKELSSAESASGVAKVNDVGEITLHVPSEHVTTVFQQILTQGAVDDITIQDVPLEDIISELFSRKTTPSA